MNDWAKHQQDKSTRMLRQGLDRAGRWSLLRTGPSGAAPRLWFIFLVGLLLCAALFRLAGSSWVGS